MKWPFTKRSETTANRDADKYKWPDCEPIDKTDPYWEFNNNININGVNYYKVEVSPGSWQWVENEEANRRQMARERHRRDLFHALWTRPITAEEEAEAMAYGDKLNIENMVSYQPEAKRRELLDAWHQQRRLQLLERSMNKSRNAV